MKAGMVLNLPPGLRQQGRRDSGRVMKAKSLAECFHLRL